MNIKTLFVALTAGLSVASAALGQSLPGQLPVDTGSDFTWQKVVQASAPATVHTATVHMSGSNYAPPTPEQQAKIEKAARLGGTAFYSLKAGRYAEAEAEAQASMSLIPDDGMVLEVLAASLDAQGKTDEALQAYQALTRGEKGTLGGQPRVLLPYALLLLNSGHWAQAVAAYNAALPFVGDSFANVEARLKAAGPSGRIVQDGEVLASNSHFSPDVPEPGRLALMIHLARGVKFNAEEDWAHDPQNTEAFAEYGKALQLAPNSGLTNYYYGVGWNKLSPAERTKFGSAQQAKAALQKAVNLAEGPIKVAAQKALMVAMKTK